MCEENVKIRILFFIVKGVIQASRTFKQAQGLSMYKITELIVKDVLLDICMVFSTEDYSVFNCGVK